MEAKSIGIGTTTETKQIGEGEEMIVELTPRPYVEAVVKRRGQQQRDQWCSSR